MYNSNTDVGLWKSKLSIPIIFGLVEQDDVCESSGFKIRIIKALANPQGTISFPCGVICDDFKDIGEGESPRSQCKNSTGECLLAPRTWNGKKLEYT